MCRSALLHQAHPLQEIAHAATDVQLIRRFALLLGGVVVGCGAAPAAAPTRCTARRRRRVRDRHGRRECHFFQERLDPQGGGGFRGGWRRQLRGHHGVVETLATRFRGHPKGNGVFGGDELRS